MVRPTIPASQRGCRPTLQCSAFIASAANHPPTLAHPRSAAQNRRGRPNLIVAPAFGSASAGMKDSATS